MPENRAERRKLDARKHWQAVLGSLEVQIANKADFDAFLSDSRAHPEDTNTLVVTVRNGFVAEWIRQRVMKSLRRTVDEVYGREIEIEIRADTDADPGSLVRDGLFGDHVSWASANLQRQKVAFAKENAKRFPLCADFTFERFCISPSNTIAARAAIETSNSATPCFNPLTILSETGQGKTHLLHAIAHQMRASGKNVICIKAEDFLTNFVQSSISGNVNSTRDRFQAADALLLDGIEKLIGKKETQIFFLDVIEHVASSDRQVVVSANSSHPLHQLSDEIVSRLSGGLEVTMSPPDAELRRALLKQHSIDRGIALASDALDFLANRAVRSARELIGGITRVAAHVDLGPHQLSSSKPVVSRAVAIEAVRNRLTAPSPRLSSPAEVVNAVAMVCGVSPDALTRSSRGNRNTSAARDLAVYLLRENCGLTSSETGELMGGRSHSTVIVALQRYSKRRRQEIDAMRNEQEVQRVLSQQQDVRSASSRRP